MKNYQSKFEDFETAKLSKNQQKTVQGGDEDYLVDPNSRDGKGAGII